MSELRQRLADIGVQADEVRERLRTLHGHQIMLRDERTEVMRQILIEEQLLANTDWNYLGISDNGIILECESSWQSDSMQPLVDLLEPDYHASYEVVGREVVLRFDDGDIPLTIRPDLLEEVKRTIGIRVHFNDAVEKALERIKQASDVLDSAAKHGGDVPMVVIKERG